MKKLNAPQPTRVWMDRNEQPQRVEWRGRVERVESLLDAWCVDDLWWSENPVRRVYFELQLVSGAHLIISWDMSSKQWMVQR